MSDCAEFPTSQGAKDFATNSQVHKEIMTEDGEYTTTAATDGQNKITLAELNKNYVNRVIGSFGDAGLEVTNGQQSVKDPVNGGEWKPLSTNYPVAVPAANPQDGSWEQVNWNSHVQLTDLSAPNAHPASSIYRGASTVDDDLTSLESLPLSRTPTSIESPLVFSPKKAAFAFHFDGPYINNFTNLLDKADELGVKVGIGAIKSITNGAYGGTNESATWGYVSDYVSAIDRGHEIYNHGASDNLDLSPGTNVPEGVQDYWINSSHDWLRSLGINAQMWVTSNGKPVTDQTAHLDPKYIPKILEKHSVVFGRTSTPWNDPNGFEGASYGANTNVNKEGLTRANIEGAAIADIENFIDFCIDNNRVAIFAAHDSANSSQVDVAKFEAIVNYIHSKGAKVLNSQQLFASFTNLFSDDGTTSKAANSSTLENSAVFHENLLTTSDLTAFTKVEQAGIGTTTLNSFGDDRQQGEQFAIDVDTPTIINSTVEFRQIINRPFNQRDVETLALTIEFISNDISDFGVACKIQYYDALDAGGSLVKEFNKGGLQSIAGISQEITAFSTNLFAYNNVQSVQVIYEIANKTTWTGVKTLNLFNPRFNRGSVASPFIKKRINPNVLTQQISFQGNVKGIGGQMTMTTPVNTAKMIKIEVGVNNSNQDLRGSVFTVYNTSEIIKVKAFGGTTGAIYSEFELRFNNPNQLEIINRTDVGGGDFAVIGVYTY